MNNSSSLIELIDRELEAKTGVFLNPKTGNTWELYIQEGKLMVEVPNFSFQISPSSNTRFRPLNTLINLEIEFEKLSKHKTLCMHIYAKGIKRATFFLF
ncbi:hypothetical protein [Chroococcidiopsis sp. CCMEE 29]|uniref:hypothetical protein n=1 Tax=Chroococcidiopsis sp. CCMEE 29 TaxID=155894 RepID=UPI0020224A3D|nr:hypothetical protein [Chroococcidiopsis sp. CCMEE 29]